MAIKEVVFQPGDVVLEQVLIPPNPSMCVYPSPVVLPALPRVAGAYTPHPSMCVYPSPVMWKLHLYHAWQGLGQPVALHAS